MEVSAVAPMLFEAELITACASSATAPSGARAAMMIPAANVFHMESGVNEGELTNIRCERTPSASRLRIIKIGRIQKAVLAWYAASGEPLTSLPSGWWEFLTSLDAAR